MKIILRTAVLLDVVRRTAVCAFAGFVMRAGGGVVFEEVALALGGRQAINGEVHRHRRYGESNRHNGLTWPLRMWCTKKLRGLSGRSTSNAGCVI